MLDARHFGVPQERRRLFIVGIRSDIGVSFEFPRPTHRLAHETNDLPSCPTIRDAIGHLPEWPEGEYDEQPFHWYYMSRNRYRDWDSQSQTVVANSRHTPLHPISPRLIKMGADHWRFADTRPARRLSYREIALLQGFDPGFVIPEDANIRTKYRVIGNAVPPPLFAAVARALPSIW
jgi:DNA (cytosine-5)-methyltransferase 1